MATTSAMRGVVLGVLGLALAMSTTACFSLSANVYRHLPSRAADSAEAFAVSAFVDGNVDAAYDRAAPELRDAVPAEQAAR